MAFIGDTAVSHIAAKVGYTGEGIILEATALGLDTRWAAGLFHPAKVAQSIDLSPGERVFATANPPLISVQTGVRMFGRSGPEQGWSWPGSLLRR